MIEECFIYNNFKKSLIPKRIITTLSGLLCHGITYSQFPGLSLEGQISIWKLNLGSFWEINPFGDFLFQSSEAWGAGGVIQAVFSLKILNWVILKR